MSDLKKTPRDNLAMISREFLGFPRLYATHNTLACMSVSGKMVRDALEAAHQAGYELAVFETRNPVPEPTRVVPSPTDERGWFTTLNPDDDMYYVRAGKNGVATATFSNWMDADTFCKSRCPMGHEIADAS